ncbi:MAG: hypothetical protein KAY27_03985 [Pedobacter sp.]|nr:hypothetical protein [Pedobacter sp.]
MKNYYLKRLKNINNTMMLKNIFLILVLATSIPVKAQLHGSLETNATRYVDDNKIKLEEIEAMNRFRSNNYLRLDYTYKQFSAGVQLESYQPKALLNYAPKLTGTNLGSYYLNYHNRKIGLDLTAGHFYEQFGNGLVFRTWEDRQLGIANSIAGGRIKFTPQEAINITALYGKQRNGLGFDFTKGTILGLNTELDISSLLKFNETVIGVGASFVNRNYKESNLIGVNENTYLTSIRGSIKEAGFFADIEYAFKTKDALVEFNSIRPDLQFDGDAYLLNLGYSRKGFGINTSLRRLENFGFYSQRDLHGNAYNQGSLNYIPALTKQYDYGLTNIYVYAAQPNISFEPNRNKAGEIGGQIDLYYNFKKGSLIGGKYGTNIALNYAQWNGLHGIYDAENRKYKAYFPGFGQKYYRDGSIELRKKWDNKWSTVITYLNQYYNTRYVEEAVGEVNANTLVLDQSLQLGIKSIRLELQHQWADSNFKNWLATQLEFNFNGNWSVFGLDLYNYGNDLEAKKIHYYNFGGTYKKGATRIQTSYGRQRGGLICVGGVCRFVPESVGLNVGINFSF